MFRIMQRFDLRILEGIFVGIMSRMFAENMPRMILGIMHRIVVGMLQSINIQCMRIIIPSIIEHKVDYYAHNNSRTDACGQISNYGHERF